MKNCPYCNMQLEDDSLFCEFCGNRLTNITDSFNFASEKEKRKAGKAAIVTLSIFLSLAVIGAGFLGYLYYDSEIYYEEQISSYEKKLSDLQTDYNSVKSDRDSYKKKYEKANGDLLLAKSNSSTFDSLMSEIKNVSPTNSYGGFDSKIYAVKKGEKITISFPYTYSKEITGWYNDYGYEMDWLDSTYNTLKFTVKGKNPGVYIIRVNHNGTSDTGGITAVIYVYE